MPLTSKVRKRGQAFQPVGPSAWPNAPARRKFLVFQRLVGAL